MPEIGTSGSMSGDGKRSAGLRPQATAPILDSTTANSLLKYNTWHSTLGTLRRFMLVPEAFGLRVTLKSFLKFQWIDIDYLSFMGDLPDRRQHDRGRNAPI